MALAIWAVLARPAATVRAAVSPWKIVGHARPERWRSLARWTHHAERLLAVPVQAAVTVREAATRIARVTAARAPPTADVVARAFVGAQL